ncbi:MAG: cytochrome b [Janthinobacterium lividum]
MDHPARYTRPAMVLHWLVAALVTVGAALGLSAELFPKNWIGPAIDLHKSVGITVLCLMLVRMSWRLTHAPPPVPAGRGRLERLAAQAAHLALYGLVLALPLSGWVHDSAFAFAARHPLRLFGVLPWPRLGFVEAMAPDAKLRLHARWFAIHVALFYTLCAVSALHVAGVLKHQFRDRDRPLRRMWS